MTSLPTRLTAEQVAAIRERDAELARVQPASVLTAEEHDRRDLLAHIADMDKTLRGSCPEHLRAATSPAGSVQNYIVELEQRVAAVEGELATTRNDLQATQCAEKMLADDLAACRRDAERYRWLDEHSPVITASPEEGYCVWRITFHSPYGVGADEYDLDAAIDAALSAQAGTGEG